MPRVIVATDHASITARRLRRAILCQLASPLVLAVGCTPTPPTNDEGGVTTNPGSGDGDSDSGPMEEGESVEETGPLDDEGDEGVRFDVSLLDIPPPLECTMDWWLTEEEIAEMYPDCELGPFDPDLYFDYFHLCVGPIDGDCSDICPPDMLCEKMELCYWGAVYDMCGPYKADDGSCCLMIAGETPPPVGRPFVVGGQLRLASVEGGPGDRVAVRWLEMARGEHASVAAFARFVAVLQRFAAPARLVGEALRAAADEVRHAQQMLALAAKVCGRELQLGPLVVADAMRETDDLAAALRAAVLEGCVDETLSAHEAACEAEGVEDPQVASVLRQIAEDEARHAALAWRFVAWVLERRPELRSVVVEAFESAAASRSELRRVGMREIVEPCAARLLAA